MRNLRRIVVGGLILLAIVVVLGNLGDEEAEPDTRPTTTVTVADDEEQPEGLPAPSGTIPEDRMVFNSDRTGTFEVYTMAMDGSDVRQLTDDDSFDSWWGRLSPDRRHVLFYRTPPGVHDLDFTETSLWMMNADGSELVELRPPGTDGWALQGHAEWSPDGEHLVMFGGSRTNPQIFVTSATGRDPRQVTDRGGTNIDPSFSPDGATIFFVGCPRAVCFERNYEIYSISADGTGEAARLTDDDLRDHDPYVSPDGTQVAWLTRSSTRGPAGEWGIRIAEVDGSNQLWVIDDGNINSKPEWSRDGTLIYFHRLEIGVHEGFSIFSIRPDGTDLREITEGQPGVNEFPST